MTKSRWIFIVGGLAVIVALGVVIPTFLDRPSQQVPQTPQLTLKPYTNTKYGYALMIPEGYEVRATGPDSAALDQLGEVAVTTPQAQGGNFILQVRYPVEGSGQNFPAKMAEVWALPVREYAYRIWQGNREDKNPNIQDKRVSDMREFTLDGQPAYGFTLTGSYYGEDVDGGSVLNEEIEYVITGKGSMKYQMSYPTSDEVWKRIAETFKYNP